MTDTETQPVIISRSAAIAQIGALARIAVIAGGASLVTGGRLTHEELVMAAGAVITIVGYAVSAYRTYRNHKKAVIAGDAAADSVVVVK